MQKLKKVGIDSRHFFYPLGQQPCLEKEELTNSKNSLKLWKQGLYLPLGNGIFQKEVEATCKAVRKLIS